MKLFGIELRKASKAETSRTTAYSAFGGRASLSSRSKPMLLSTVYRCVDLISDSVGVLPLKTYRLDRDGFKSEAKDLLLYDILNNEPNENMSRFTFFKTLMASVLLTGNGYAYIERDGNNNVSQLIYLPSNQVEVKFVTDSSGILRKRYAVNGWEALVEPKDMIHVLNFSYDGIIGVSTLTHARQTIDIATSTEEHAQGFFTSGAALNGVLKVEGVRLTKDQKDQIYNTWNRHYDSVNGTTSGIAILEGNMSYQPISVSPRDSQFLESREFDVVDICRFFSVSPVKAFDLSKSSYSTVEATQLQYLTDTVLAVITKIEQELNRKLLMRPERTSYSIEFDTSVLLRTDKAAQAAYYQTMFNLGAATPNEIRREVNLSRIEGGDTTFVQVNLQTLEKAISNETEQTDETDSTEDTDAVRQENG